MATRISGLPSFEPRSKRSLRVLWLVPALLPLLACPPVKKERPTLPVYEVTRTGLDSKQSASLAKLVGAPAESTKGAFSYWSDDFLALPLDEAVESKEENEDGEPTVGQTVDLDTLAELETLAGAEAIKLAQELFTAAGLPMESWAPVEAEMVAAQTMLHLVDRDGQPLLDREALALDTHVDFKLSLEGLPLVGPGAQVKVVYDSSGQPLHLSYAMRGLVKSKPFEIVPPEEAPELCAGLFRGASGEVAAEAELVYYAPPSELEDIQLLFPHYRCSGTLRLGEREVTLRTRLVPAVLDRPEVSIAEEVDGARVLARAVVSGGTPPYTYSWSASTPGAELAAEPGISYDMAGVPDQARRESLAVTVLDANGLQAASTVSLLPPLAEIPAVFAPDRDVGSEWIGTCGGLPLASANAGWFVSLFAATADWDADFNFGNEAAWERDFVDQSVRADGFDHLFADDVDFLFYTGHADGGGFAFCSNEQDGTLHFQDNPRWGDSTDLEWLTIASCGPLQLDWGGRPWWQRWGPAFEGLHLILAYQNESADNLVEGTKLAGKTLAGRTVSQSWIETAIEVQGPSVRWGVMGVLRETGAGLEMAGWQDHIWGRGPVGPDVRGAAKRGYWMVHGGC